MDEHTFPRASLEDYLDRSLDAVEILLVESHLEACLECRADLQSMTELRDRARDLPDEIAPSRDLWPEIAARIASGPVLSSPPPPMVDIRPIPRRTSYGRHWMAAAAVVTLVIGSGTTAYFLREDSLADGATVSERGVRTASAVGLAAFQPAEVEYRNTVELLEAELEERRGRLLPETVATVESNLAIIDEAIFEARAALAADPTSADLPLLLSGVYLRKVELLRTALDLSARS